jgi:hypothetical protein
MGGFHSCRCRATSSCCDHFLPDGTMTNSLCIHYVAHHRDSVPSKQLQVIEAFDWGEAEPTDDDLLGPDSISAATRQMVERSLGQAALQTWREWGLDMELFSNYLRSYDSKAREDAEDLFSFLLNMKSVVWPLSKVQDRLNRDVKAWGAGALQLPDWDGAAWLAPMIELLRVDGLGRSERRCVACQFWHLRKTSASIPDELLELCNTAEGDLRDAALLATRQLAEG